MKKALISESGCLFLHKTWGCQTRIWVADIPVACGSFLVAGLVKHGNCNDEFVDLIKVCLIVFSCVF